VVEVRDLECLGRVTTTALEYRRRQPELAKVNIVVTPAAVPREAAVARPLSGLAIFGGWVMATVALRRGMGTDERPDTVIDLR
jgi:hypothetical protein